MKLIHTLKRLRMSEILFGIFVLMLPVQTRILYSPSQAYIGPYFDYHLAVFVYLTDIILLACFASWLIFDPIGLSVDQIFWLILAFLGLVFASLFYVKRRNLGLYEAFKWVEIWLIVMYIWSRFRSFPAFLTCAWLIWISSLIQAGIGIWQFHVQRAIGLTWLGEYIAPIGTPGLATIDIGIRKIIRSYGTMPHPNLLGAFLLFGLLMGFFLVSRGTFRQKVIIYSGSIIITIGLFLSFSRLAWAGTIVAALCWVVYLWLNGRRHNAYYFLGIAIVSCATLFFSYHPYLHARLADDGTKSVSDRALFNQIGLELTEHFPVLGVGVGNYVVAMQDLYALAPWQYQPAHNIFIFVAAEFGILGVALFAIILMKIFHRAWSQPSSDIKFLVLTGGIIFLIIGQFDHYFLTIQQGRLMFALMLGLLMALPNLNASDEKTD